MGDIGIIARRLTDGRVQYGWSGNGCCLNSAGVILQLCYDTPEKIESLFSLGQLRLLAYPGSENGTDWFKNTPSGRPHWFGTSERDVFSKIAFIDYTYFYETSEGKWYFLDSESGFVVKVPLKWCVEYMEKYLCGKARYNQGPLLAHIQHIIISSLLHKYGEDPSFTSWCTGRGIKASDVNGFDTIMRNRTQNSSDCRCAMADVIRNNRYEDMVNYFDPWAVLDPESESAILFPKTETHIETIDRICAEPSISKNESY